MGQVLIKLGDDLNAERFLDQAIQADPNYAPAHLHLGFLYLVRGDNTPRHPGANPGQHAGPRQPHRRPVKVSAAVVFPLNMLK